MCLRAQGLTEFILEQARSNGCRYALRHLGAPPSGRRD
jgi:hypothetical protein